MKSSFFVFFLIVLSIYAIGNTYLFVRGWQALEIVGRQRVWFAVLFWMLALSFIITQIMRLKGAEGALFDAACIIGSYWVAIMLYGFLILLAIDILRIAGWAGDIRPEWIYRNYPIHKAMLFGLVCCLMAVILGFGYKNAHHPRITRLEIPVAKQAGQLAGLRIAMISDVHLGHITGRKFLSCVVDVLNEQHADVILIAGDTFDGNPQPVILKDMGMEFERLKTTYGVYVVSGNHEYIGEREEKNAVDVAFDYLAKHRVKPLQDTVVFIDSSFYIAGRKDRQAAQRKTVHDLLSGVDRQLPIILLDHQPHHFEKAEQAGVDLQLSGHTHHGQMWPLNYITKKIFEQDWGYLRKGESNFYVSCGVGTWGPPIRTAGHSEIVVIDLKFNH